MKHKLLYLVILFTNFSLRKLTANPLSAQLIISPSSDVINQPTKQLFVLSCKVNVDQQDLFITLRWFDPRGQEITPVYARDKNPDITTQEYLLAGLLYLQFKKPRTDDSGTYTCKGFIPNFEPIQAQTQVQFYGKLIFSFYYKLLLTPVFSDFFHLLKLLFSFLLILLILLLLISLLF